MARLKPGRWTVDPSLVDPAFRDLWRNLTWAAPLWEASGQAFAYPARILSTDAEGTWEPTQWGIGHQLNDTGSSEEIEWPINNGHDLVPNNASSGDVAFTITVAYNQTGYTGTFPALVGHRNSFTAGYWSIFYASIGVNDILDFVFHDGSGLQYSNFGAGSWPGSGYHIVTVYRKVGGDVGLYVDGLFVAETNISTDPPTTGQESHALRLGELASDAAGNNVEGDYLVFYFHQGRALTEADIRRLHADPFGPFRLAPILALQETGAGSLLSHFAHLMSGS